jgi:(heptosyl)LPS beta-1,4-glucosyltransferase
MTPIQQNTACSVGRASDYSSMSTLLPISGVVIVKNEADRIARCVQSLRAVCQEVIVLDSGSTDDTVATALAAGARVEHQDWLGFATQKNAVIARATQPWVLLLDADEWLGEDAGTRLHALFGDHAMERADVWMLERRTHFLGSALEHGGWGREAVARLFRPTVRYLPAEVHEALDLSGLRIGRTRIRIEHDTARSLDEYRAKLDRYAGLWAQQRFAAGRRAGKLAAPLHAAAYWLKNFLLRGGFLDGAAGWSYHARHTRYVFAKYARLNDLAQAARQ